METKRLIVSTNYINFHASDRERKRQSNDRMRKRVRRETVKTGEERQTTAGLPYYFFLTTKTTTTSCNNKCRIRETNAPMRINCVKYHIFSLMNRRRPYNVQRTNLQYRKTILEKKQLKFGGKIGILFQQKQTKRNFLLPTVALQTLFFSF